MAGIALMCLLPVLYGAVCDVNGLFSEIHFLSSATTVIVTNKQGILLYIKYIKYIKYITYAHTIYNVVHYGNCVKFILKLNVI